MNFSSKVVIVTGGSSGIGAAAAIAFAKEGALVSIVGRNETKLNEVSEKIGKVGKKPLIIKADISKVNYLKEIVKQTLEKHGKIDVLINNAGMYKTAVILDENLPEIYDETMNTNLKSVVLLTHFVAPHLIKTKGNIVNISSVAGTSSLAGLGVGNIAYCTSKAGLDHFSRVAALELAEKGVRVNVVSPGPVDTPLIGNADKGPLIAATALKLLTEPTEISDIILYLASDKSRSFTGSVFVVDCGLKLKMFNAYLSR